MKVIVRLISAVLSIGSALLINYLALPAWNLRSTGFWAYIIVVSIISLVFFGIGEYILYEEEDSTPICSFAFGGLAIFSLVVVIVLSIASSKMFNAGKYQKIIEIENGNFQTDITEATDKNITAVDLETARKVGDRTIGTIKNASWYEVDNEYNLIILNGKSYRLSPLNYGGFFKYRKAKTSGIPGYVLVNAVTQEAKYVKLDDPIIYSPSAYFSKNLRRLLRNNYPSKIFDSFFFEIDEEGNPFYIVSVVSPQIKVFGGKKVTQFVIVNCCNGTCEIVDASKLPDWIDHGYSVGYLTEMVYYNLEFVNGYWNHLTSQTGVLKTSYSYRDGGYSGYNSIVSKEGVVFYTGLTPANVSESNVGFITLNPKTGKIKRYDYPGAEESSAQMAAEGLVQNLGYIATFPNILNVNGIPTYFMVLKDNAGLIQRYSFCNIANYTEVVEAKTLEEALKLYNEKIDGNTEQETKTEPEKEEITGTIEAIYSAEIDGNTYFYYKLEDDTKLYKSSIKNGSIQVSLKVGDVITLTSKESSEEGVLIVSKVILK